MSLAAILSAPLGTVMPMQPTAPANELLLSSRKGDSGLHLCAGPFFFGSFRSQHPSNFTDRTVPMAPIDQPRKQVSTMQKLLFLLLCDYFRTFRLLLEPVVREYTDQCIQKIGLQDPEAAESISRSITRTLRFSPVTDWDHDYLDH